MIKAVNYDTIYINIKRLFFIFQQCFCGFWGLRKFLQFPLYVLEMRRTVFVFLWSCFYLESGFAGLREDR